MSNKSVKADVAIIGGGVTGCSLLQLLTSNGVNCLLVERNKVGSGSSCQGSGLVWFGMHYYYNVARKVFGASRAKALWEMSFENSRLYRKLVTENGIDCITKTGILINPSTEPEIDALEESVQLLRDEHAINAEKHKDGYYFPDCYLTEITKYISEIVSKHSDKIIENDPVRAIKPEKGEIRLMLDNRELTSNIVVITAGSQSSELYNFFNSIIFSVRQQVYTNPQGFETPIVTNALGTMCVGKQILSFRRNTENFVKSAFPNAVRETDRVIAFSCDEFPNIGPVPGTVNILAGVGYQGHELNFAFITARIICDIILRGKTDYPISIFNMRRHT